MPVRTHTLAHHPPYVRAAAPKAMPFFDFTLQATIVRLPSSCVQFCGAIAALEGEGTVGFPLNVTTVRRMGGTHHAADAAARDTELDKYLKELIAEDPGLKKDPAAPMTDAQHFASQLANLELLYEAAKGAAASMLDGTLTTPGDGFDDAKAQACGDKFREMHGFPIDPQQLAPFAMQKLIYDIFVKKGEYPIGKDTSLYKMHPVGGSLQSQIAGTGDPEGFLNFLAVSSEGGGGEGTTLQAKQTAFKDRDLKSSPQLFDSFELKLHTMAYVAIGLQAPPQANGREYGVHNGSPQYASYAEVRKIFQVLSQYREHAPIEGSRPLIFCAEQYITSAMRGPSYLTPSACFAHVAQQLQQGFAQLTAMAAMMIATSKRIAPTSNVSGKGSTQDGPSKKKPKSNGQSGGQIPNNPAAAAAGTSKAKAARAPTTDGAGTLGPGGFERMTGGNITNPRKCGTATCGATHACSFSHADK